MPTPARPSSRPESIPIPAARGSICILFLSPLRRPVAKIYWFRARFHCLFGVRETVKQPIPLGGGVKRCSPRAAIPRGPRRLGMREQQPGVPDQNDFYAKRDAGRREPVGAARERRRSSRFGISLLLPEPSAGIPSAPLDAASPSRLQSPLPSPISPFSSSWPDWARCPFPSLVPTPPGLSVLCSSRQDTPVPNPQIVPRRFYIHL